MFLYKLKILNIFLIFAIKKKFILYQLLIDNINKKCEIIIIKKKLLY